MMSVWTGNRWILVIRVFAAKYAGAAAFQPMSTTTNDFTGSQVGDNSKCESGAIVYDLRGKPLRTSTGTFLTTETAMAISGMVSAIKMASVVLEAEAGETIPAYSAVYFTEFNKINLCKSTTPRYSAIRYCRN